MTAVTSLPRVCLFIFHYERGLVLKIVFDKKKLVHIFSHFFIFHFRALLTEEMEKEHAHINGGGCNKLATCLLSSSFCLENVQFYYFFFPNCVCTRALHMCFHCYMCKDLAHSSQFPHTPSHARAVQAHHVPLFCRSLTPSSILFPLMCIGWRHGSHDCLVQRSHRRREAPPGGRRGQGGEGRGKRD